MSFVEIGVVKGIHYLWDFPVFSSIVVWPDVHKRFVARGFVKNQRSESRALLIAWIRLLKYFLHLSDLYAIYGRELHTTPLNTCEFPANRHRERRTFVTGVGDVTWRLYRETAWHFDSKDIFESSVQSSGASSCWRHYTGTQLQLKLSAWCDKSQTCAAWLGLRRVPASETARTWPSRLVTMFQLRVYDLSIRISSWLFHSPIWGLWCQKLG